MTDDLESLVEEIAREKAQSGDDPHTSLDTVAARVSKEAERFDGERGNAKSAVRDIAERRLVYWHGLIGPRDEDCLAAWVQQEAQADITRDSLVGQINTLRQDLRGESA